MKRRRSGLLTQVRVNQICRWVEKLPNDLKKVAKACNIYPADLLYWYALGQTYDCPEPLCAELAWRIAEIRANKAARNQARIEAAADGGKKIKTVSKPRTGEDASLPPIVETTEEDVLPAAWAIERLEKQANESAWEIAPNDDIAEDLIHAFESSKAVPILTEGEGDEQPEADPEGDGAAAGLHPGPLGADHVPGGPAPWENGRCSDPDD